MNAAVLLSLVLVGFKVIPLRMSAKSNPVSAFPVFKQNSLFAFRGGGGGGTVFVVSADILKSSSDRSSTKTDTK